MNQRRRLASGLALAAAVLFLGRIAALTYADSAWYDALGAAPLWRERLRDMIVIHLASAAFAGLFALLNLSAVRRSIMSLAFPRRLGNVEFGEEVPRRMLDRASFVLAAGVAALMVLVVPSWVRLALVRTGVSFGESDPFFQMDLSFYTAWLPLEQAVYLWSVTLIVLVSALVIALYALTPSLRWHHGSFHVSVRVRRHLTALASLFLLTMAWGYRLDGYELLMHGSGSTGMFSYVDHQWLIPAYLSLSIGTVAAAALVLVSGWTGQVRAGFFTISAVLIFSIALDLILPSIAGQLDSSTVETARQAPYTATRAAFNARAYGFPRNAPQTVPLEVGRFDSLSDSARVAQLTARARDSALVFPGATSAALVRNGPAAAAPRLGGGLRRLALAWAEQRLDLAWSDDPANSRIARRRDVRQRVNALAPVYAQGSDVVPAFLGDSLVWIVELYSASSTYPLSKRFVLAGEERSYFRHSATALVNAATGRVILVPAVAPDPIATAWRQHFPANFRAGTPDILDELTAAPGSPGSIATGTHLPPTDAAFRGEVARLYARMRAALAAGNLQSFGAAWDSLGTVVTPQSPIQR